MLACLRVILPTCSRASAFVCLEKHSRLEFLVILVNGLFQLMLLDNAQDLPIFQKLDLEISEICCFMENPLLEQSCEHKEQGTKIQISLTFLCLAEVVELLHGPCTLKEPSAAPLLRLYPKYLATVDH